MNKEQINTTNTTANVSIEEVECEKNNKYNQLREEIIKAVPEIKYRVGIGEYPHRKEITKEKDINLEDVLVSSKKPLAVTNCGLLLIKKDISANARYISSGINWKPHTPLQDQSDEVYNLLWDLICKDG